MIRGSFEDLKIWQKSMSLVTIIYQVTKDFPKEERYDLTSQMRRAAVSIPSNIAEGSQRSSKKEFMHFILIAKGSLAELQTQIRIAGNLQYIPNSSIDALFSQADEIHKMIFSFYTVLKSDD